MGIVTGLNGTGDGSFGPTISVADAGHAEDAGPAQQRVHERRRARTSPLANLNPKNVALVVVTAEVPVEGASAGG